jgi:hypothetical protein
VKNVTLTCSARSPWSTAGALDTEEEEVKQTFLIEGQTEWVILASALTFQVPVTLFATMSAAGMMKRAAPFA